MPPAGGSGSARSPHAAGRVDVISAPTLAAAWPARPRRLLRQGLGGVSKAASEDAAVAAADASDPRTLRRRARQAAAAVPAVTAPTDAPARSSWPSRRLFDLSDAPELALLLIMDRCATGRDAAMLALTCSRFSAAHDLSLWPRRDAATGAVLPPRSGRFGAIIKPGGDVQTALDALPRGGCAQLLPGAHELPATLCISQEVHVFGSGPGGNNYHDASAGPALLRYSGAAGDAVVLSARRATLDSLALERAPGGLRGSALRIAGGVGRVQACSLTCASFAPALTITGGRTRASISDSRVHHGRGHGIDVTHGARARLEGVTVESNRCGGLWLMYGGGAALARCVVRDHASGRSGIGLLVSRSSRGRDSVDGSTEFSGNSGGDHVRK